MRLKHYSTIDLIEFLGTSSNKLSKTRAYLINHGIIASPECGKIMFCIPYLADYVKKEEQTPDTVAVAKQHRVWKGYFGS